MPSTIATYTVLAGPKDRSTHNLLVSFGERAGPVPMIALTKPLTKFTPRITFGNVVSIASMPPLFGCLGTLLILDFIDARSRLWVHCSDATTRAVALKTVGPFPVHRGLSNGAGSLPHRLGVRCRADRCLTLARRSEPRTRSGGLLLGFG